MECSGPRKGRLLFLLLLAQIPTVRVLVDHEKQSVRITGYDLVVSQNKTEKTLIQADKQASVSFNCTLSGKIKMTLESMRKVASGFSAVKKNKVLVESPLEVHSLGGFLRVDRPHSAEQPKYRGDLYVHASDGHCMVVNHVDLEKYIVGLLDSEMSARWSMQALMAQAIAARTYAVYQMRANTSINAPYDLDSSVKDQVYEGAHREKYRAYQAALATRGLILTYQGKPIKAFYHSTCGGHTQDPQKVWGHGYSYLKPVKCGFCETSPRFRWQYGISIIDFEKKLQAHGLLKGNLVSIGVLRKSSLDQVNAIEIQSQMRTVVAAPRFRELLGNTNLRSTDFKILQTPGKFLFVGHGSGHGVGLCQWGAKTMAESGYRYQEILMHYYPEVEISRLY